ncbi:MAG: immunoglobulin-like domain-containing protein [bacterium]
MKKLFFIIILIFFLIFPNLSFATQCFKTGYTIATINGIFTDKRAAEDNLITLINEFRSYSYNNQNVDYQYLHNPSHYAGLGDLLDSVEQGLFDEKSDYDLIEMLNDASQKVTTQKVLLVAHSQGNFYSNNFYDMVASKEGGVPKESIGMYGVASPDDHVSGGGQYLTSDSDRVIAKAVGRVLKILTPNIHIPLTKEDGSGHDFANVYLKYQGDKIISDIKESLNKLKENNEQEREAPCISPPELSIAHKIEGAVLFVADPLASVTKDVAVGAAVGTYNIGKTIVNTTIQIANATASSIYSVAKSIAGIFGGTAGKNSAAVILADNEPAETPPDTKPEVVKENPKVIIKTTTPKEVVMTSTSPTDEPPLDVAINKTMDAVAEVPVLPVPTEAVLVESPPLAQKEETIIIETPVDSSDIGTSETPIRRRKHPDIIPPIVTLVGDNPITIVVGTSYTDSGATASDDIDKDITANIVTVNPVDVNVIADYTITYNVKDKAGNSATEVTRLVHVVRSNVLYSQLDNSTEISFGSVSSFNSFTGASGHVQSIKFAYNDYGNSTGHFVGVAVVDRTAGVNYYASMAGGECGDAYESTGVNTKIIVELDSAVKYKAYPCTGPELVLDPTHTYGVNLFRNHGGENTQRFYGSSNSNNSIYLNITDDTFPSTGKSVKVFNFLNLGAKGIVDEVSGNIDITVPFGTDITALTPSIKISGGASISPDNNIVQNFTNPIIYVVTAENGLSQSYITTVSIHSNVLYSQLNNSVEITGAGNVSLQNVFTGATGNISNLKFSYNDHGNKAGHFIGVQITDKTAAKGYYVYKSGFGECGDAYQSTDANIPVIVNLDETYQYRQYPCTGPNLVLDPTHIYNVNLFRNQGGVDIQRFYGSSNISSAAYLHIETNGVATQSSAKQINTFNFNGLSPSVIGAIDEVNHIVSIAVPFGTNVTALVPTITISPYASISPNNKIAQDFSSPVAYTITAENGSTQIYVVMVTVASL